MANRRRWAGAIQKYGEENENQNKDTNNTTPWQQSREQPAYRPNYMDLAIKKVTANVFDPMANRVGNSERPGYPTYPMHPLAAKNGRTREVQGVGNDIS